MAWLGMALHGLGCDARLGSAKQAELRSIAQGGADGDGAKPLKDRLAIVRWMGLGRIDDRRIFGFGG